jgi:ornithine cyclodeaminase/alanine dehydrogenase-like protein (mu-crystallin family)
MSVLGLGRAPVRSRSLVISAHEVREVVRAVGLEHFIDEVGARLGPALAAAEVDGRLKVRDGFPLEETGTFEWMPYMEGDAITIKTVSYVPGNPAISVPTILATLHRHDAATGRLVAMADGVLLTALRTAATSMIASRILASPRLETLGIVGAGAQAVAHVSAFARAFPLRRVLAYDIDADVARSFPARTARADVAVTVADLATVERESDVICTATSIAPGQGPAISGSELRPHVHINAVGSDLPGKTELSPDLLRRSTVCPDWLPQARCEGECQQLQDHEIGPSLGELCADPSRYRRLRRTPTVFDSTGWAVEDHVALDVLLDAAAECGIGTVQEIEHWSIDPRDPYALGDGG